MRVLNGPLRRVSDVNEEHEANTYGGNGGDKDQERRGERLR